MERGGGERAEFGRLPESGDGRVVDVPQASVEVDFVPHQSGGELRSVPEQQPTSPDAVPLNKDGQEVAQSFTAADLTREVPVDSLDSFEDLVIGSMER